MQRNLLQDLFKSLAKGLSQKVPEDHGSIDEREYLWLVSHGPCNGNDIVHPLEFSVNPV